MHYFIIKYSSINNTLYQVCITSILYTYYIKHYMQYEVTHMFYKVLFILYLRL